MFIEIVVHANLYHVWKVMEMSSRLEFKYMSKLCDFDNSIGEESQKEKEYWSSNLRNLKVIWDQCTQIYRYRTYKCP